ncbi:hypothetical protein NLI96_g9500 [Meripilus lineatus]|uniref:Cytochrome P450 n=1 Tax=Meripilus lineatus TaxID=2056292 RepID=A0AAD5YAX2_9APHY|nr:hypothetical protein NLI96_g9500 [Physisporinus lineatus]
MLFYFALASFIALRFWKWYTSTRGQNPLPPGPPSLPILGHALVMPRKDQAGVFLDWSKRYGDVVHVEALGQSIIILGSHEAAYDLLEKRSVIYSDRPRFPTFELPRTTFTPTLHGNAIVKLLSHYIAYGHRVASANDPYPKIAERVTEILFGAGTPGLNSVDILPIQVRPEQEELQRGAFKKVQNEMATGTARHSFLSKHLEEYISSGKQDDEHLERLSLAAYHMHGVGFETTWSTVESFIFHIMRFPEIQKRVHEELDRVLGGRLPDYADRDSLPYLECVIQESERWHTVVPLGVPHRVMEDDIYRGMLIPKGSVVISNIQSITHDKRVYRDPETFLPERFLPKPQGFGEPIPDYNFGYGRRVCPGRYLADASIWIVAASLLTVFEICPKKDKDGLEVMPPLEYNTSLTSHPKMFQCQFNLRSEKMRATIESLA